METINAVTGHLKEDDRQQIPSFSSKRMRGFIILMVLSCFTLYSNYSMASRFAGSSSTLQKVGGESSLRSSSAAKRDWPLRLPSPSFDNSTTNDTVVIFLGSVAYKEAILQSISSLRQDGKYLGDVMVIVHESGNFTKDRMQQAIEQSFSHSEEEADGPVEKGNNPITVESTHRLMDMVLSDNNQRLRDPPPAPSECLTEHRQKGYTAYYYKMLMFHPFIASRWDTVLFLDGCVTYRLPYMPEFFQTLSRPVEGRIMAAQDSWYHAKRGIQGQVLWKCVTPEDTERLHQYVGTTELDRAPYFTTGLVMYDTSIVRDYYDTPSATLLELLELYHDLGRVFGGDQLISSLYWLYIRGKRREFQLLPTTLLGSPRIPYDFQRPRVKHGEYILVAGSRDREVCPANETAM